MSEGATGGRARTLIRDGELSRGGWARESGLSEILRGPQSDGSGERARV